jgi:perosamine synthetase
VRGLAAYTMVTIARRSLRDQAGKASMAEQIRLAAPFLDHAEEQAVVEALRSGWISHGPKCIAFEQAMADVIGVAHGRSVNSGTSAIHLALEALGIGKGDEVIVPAFTCAAAVFPIENLGATPRCVDIELPRYSLDPRKLARTITPSTKAVVVAHLFGGAADMQGILGVTKDSSVHVIEDNALGLGAAVGGRMTGSFADAACLSFHPRKMITTGEGGMLLSNSPELTARVTELRAYGASVAAWQRHQSAVSQLPGYRAAGHNFKMTDIQAAMGIEQLRKLPEIIARRRAIADRYGSRLAALPWLELPREIPGETHVFQSYVCLVRGPEPTSGSRRRLRGELIEHLAARGIASVQAAQAMASIEYFQRKYGWSADDFPVAREADDSTIALPIHPGMETGDQERVIDAILEFVPAAR